MGNFFGSFYCMLGLDQFFGLDLANYLWGLTSATVTTNQFVGVGLWMFGLTLILVLSYYYFIAKPRWANIWGWLSFMGGECNRTICYWMAMGVVRFVVR